jgi:hypothetical protein
MAAYRNVTSGVEVLQQSVNEQGVLLQLAAVELALMKNTLDNIDQEIQSLLLDFSPLIRNSLTIIHMPLEG